MKNTTYYLPIKSANLAHYFAKGCVCPTKYIENRNEDIQNTFNNFLLLSNNKFTENTNCSLEIVLYDKEENVNKITNNFFLLDIPLPISRVKKILFKEEEQKTNTTFNITSGAAFLPNNLIEVDSHSPNSNSSELDIKQIFQSNKNWNSEIDFFNRLMGGFAIMSIAGNKSQNYPLNYFNTLSNINTIVKDEIINQRIDVDNNYDWALFDNEKFTSLHNAIYSQIDNSVVESFAKKDRISLSKQNGKYLINKIDQSKTTYLVAILASYGQGARMNLDTFISDLVTNQFPEKKKEGLALIFGINKGYSAFRNQYKTNNFQIDVKFKLDSQLDYYTVESIYQFVFNKKKDNSTFDYIDSWCPKLKEVEHANGVETYQVLDKTILYKKKEEDGFFQKLFQNSSRNKIYQKIVSEINKWVPSYLQKNDLEGINHFKSIIEADFEEYTKTIYSSVENKLRNEFADKIEALKNKSAKLETTINNKDKQIKTLQEELNKFKQEENKQEYKKSIEDNNFENNLFTNTTSHNENSRELELLNTPITKLKKIAKELNIKKLSKYKKANIEELVQEILKIENN
ncbi:hypothetical protein [Mesoflavibacter zeaxanthinifaciens]|uniref:Rho termination factor N-terminal domain-containing protein n=1 Tax=Mesoflavibacter zeaxanthinifaciens TaxID=393060 RepID=UPI003A93837D